MLQNIKTQKRKSLFKHLIILINNIGNPHKRFVWISEEDNKIHWRDQEKFREKPRSICFDEVFKKNHIIIYFELIDP